MLTSGAENEWIMGVRVRVRRGGGGVAWKQEAHWDPFLSFPLQRRREYFEASLMSMGMELEATRSVGGAALLLSPCLSPASRFNLSSLCFAGGGRQTDVRQGAHAVGGAVHLRRGASHQAPHPAQRPGLPPLPLALLLLHHQVLLPQRGADRKGDRVLHRPLREGPPGLFLHKGEGSLLHSGHEEQDGQLSHCCCRPQCIFITLFLGLSWTVDKYHVHNWFYKYTKSHSRTQRKLQKSSYRLVSYIFPA